MAKARAACLSRLAALKRSRLVARSFPVRIALAAALSAAVLFSAGVWWMRHEIYTQQMHIEYTAVQNEIYVTYLADNLTSDPTAPATGPYGALSYTYEVVDSYGQVLSSSADLHPFETKHPLMPVPPQRGSFGDGPPVTVTLGRPPGSAGDPLAGRTVIALSTTVLAANLDAAADRQPPSILSKLPLSTPIRIYGFITTVYADQVVASADRVLYPALPVSVLLVAACAYFSARAGLRPVERIRARTAAVNAANPRERVEVPPGRDAIARLAETINATLQRVDEAVTAQRRFIADAAHELRSPLATLLTTLEVAQAYPDRADWLDTVGTAAEQARRLNTLSEDLLLLARLDAHASAPTGVIDVSALAANLTSEYAERSTAVKCGALEPVYVCGVPGQIERALRNLLDNAVRHADRRVELSVRAEEADGAPCAAVEVRDDGPGIPASERERVFERFTRLDDARSDAAGGTGLGLAIARDIALRHGGTVDAGDASPGACFTLRLPAADPTLPQPASAENEPPA